MTDHPITPPPELVEQWYQDGPENDELGLVEYVATQAARWGADMELEACCDFLQELLAPSEWITGLRTARRPKPQSLKEQALEALDQEEEGLNESEWEQRFAIIRRALEALPE